MSVTVLGETTPVARKQHLCLVCLGTIGVGDTYLRQRNVDGGDAYVFKGHRLCLELSIAIAKEHGYWTEDGEWPEPSEVRDGLVRWFTWEGTT